MHNPYDRHSLSKLYREDALREAQAQHLADRTRDSRGSGDMRLLGPVRRGALALLLRRGCLPKKDHCEECLCVQAGRG